MHTHKHTYAHAHTSTYTCTLGTEALELVFVCSLPGLFVAVELVAWLWLWWTFLPWRGGVASSAGVPRHAIVPWTSVVELGGAVA